MDLRTGKTYAAKQDALDDGVPASDLAEITWRDGAYWVKFDNPRYAVPHQGARELARRKRRDEAQAVGTTTTCTTIADDQDPDRSSRRQP
jgi:hypothetical protein